MTGLGRSRSNPSSSSPPSATRAGGLPTIRWKRFFASVLIGELAPLLTLVGLVALVGPTEPVEAEAFAREAGAWIGPLVGSASILLLAAWAGLPSDSPIFQGFLIGMTLASIDGALLVVMGESFEWLLLASNLGKVVAGITGGWIASRGGRRVAQ